MSLRGRPARPVPSRTAPSYPRLLLAAGSLLASSCAIYPLGDTEPQIGGAVAFPFPAADAEPDASDADAADAAETTPTDDAQPSGFTVSPYDASPDALLTTDATDAEAAANGADGASGLGSGDAVASETTPANETGETGGD